MLGLTAPDPRTVRDVSLYCILWFTLYILCLRSICRKRSAIYTNRVVSLVHAILALFVAPTALNWRHPFSQFGQTTTEQQRWVLNISLGYFTYDTLCCLYIDFDFANVIHHLCTMLGLAVGVCNGVSGAELTLCLLLMEVSNPFLHSRFLMKELGWKGSSLSTANDAAFAISFFVTRLLVGPAVVYYTLQSSTSPAIVKVGGVGIQVVSLFWFYKIVQIAVWKATQSGKTKVHAQ